MMHFIYEYDVCALIIAITLILGFVRRKTIKTRVRKSFLFLVLFQIFAIVFELIVVFLIKYPNSVSVPIFYILDILHYVFLLGISVWFLNCFYFVIEEKKRKKSSLKKLLYLVYAIQLIFVITTPFTKAVFYLDENYNYFHGPYLSLVSTLSIAFQIAVIIELIKERHILTKAQILIVLISIFVVGIIIYLENVFPQYLFLNLSTTFTILFLFFAWYNPSSYSDKEMGIFNRAAFLTTINENLIKNKKIKIVGFRIQGLKYLTNMIGLERKNLLLKELSEKLRSTFEGKTLYRLSITKFSFILKEDDTFADKFLDKLKNLFEEPFVIEDFSFSFQIRVAILHCPEQAASVDDAINILDKVLKSMEKAEAGTIVIAKKDELSIAMKENQIQSILKDAIKKNNLYVVYQPIYSVKDKRYTTAEALIRINTGKEYIGPSEFIPIAEKNGLILEIGEFVFKKVCEFIVSEKIWEKGIEYIHVNLSVVQCMQEKLYEQLFKIMDTYDLDYKYINLEVTETIAVASKEKLKVNMGKLIDKEINFSLDDFGSGFSNMSTLVEYPFHTIKIDKSIIDTAFIDAKAKTVLSYTIKMIRQLNMEVVAEGVETEEQVKELEKMGCNYLQGYFYSKPLKKDDFLGVL